MHGKYPVKRNEKILQEMCIKSVFELIRYEDAETDKEFFIWRNRTFSKSVYLKCFSYYYVRKRQNACKVLTYIGKRSDIKRNVSFECFGES